MTSNLDDLIKINWKESDNVKIKLEECTKQAKDEQIFFDPKVFEEDAPYMVTSGLLAMGLDYLGFIGEYGKIDGYGLTVAVSTGLMSGLFNKYETAFKSGFIGYIAAAILKPLATQNVKLDSIESVAVALIVPYLTALVLKYAVKN